MRARVEDAGRVKLEDGEAAGLSRTKAVHVVLIVLGLVHMATAGKIPRLAGVPSPPTLIVFLLGGGAEALGEASAVEAAKRAGKVLGAWLLGVAAVLFLAVLSVVL